MCHASPDCSRRNSMRSWRRNGRSRQNSITSGTMRKPDQRRRTRHGANRKFRSLDRDRFFKCETALERLRLLARPGADLRAARTCCKISVSLRVTHMLDRTADAHLPPQRLPVERRSGQRPAFQFSALLAVVIGQKTNPPSSIPFEQDHPDIRHAVRLNRCERHRVRIGGFVAGRFRKPRCKQPETARQLR